MASSIPRQISGNGAYSLKGIRNALKPILKEALTTGGAALGGLSGLPGGPIFGRALGAHISKIIGSGDYNSNVAVNDLINPVGMRPSMSFGNTVDHVKVTKREFIADISTSSVAGAFVNYAYPINAGLRQVFPFLSQLADNYEEYCFDGLVFEFVSSASPYITNSALGTVVASMEYNSALPAYTSKYAMENSAHAISNRLDKSLMYGVECAKGSNAQNCYYVRSGTSSLPLTTTDLGLFQLAVAPSSTVPTSTVLGELWVTYDVSLRRPNLNASRLGTYHLCRTAFTNSNPLGTVTFSSTINGAMQVVSSSSTAITIQVSPGDLIYYAVYWGGAVAAAVVYPVVTLTGGSSYNGFAQDTAGGTSAPPAATTTLSATQQGLVAISSSANNSNLTITWGTAGTLPTGTNSVDVVITLLGPTPPSGTGF